MEKNNEYNKTTHGSKGSIIGKRVTLLLYRGKSGYPTSILGLNRSSFYEIF